MSFYSKYAGEEVEQRLDAVSEIAGQVGDISGALSEVSGKVGEVSEHLALVDASVVAVGNKVDGVVASVDGVSSRVDANATNIAEVAEKVGSIEKDVDVIDESVGALGERVQALGILTTSVENLSANVTAIGRGVEQLAERVENVASELDNKQGVLESGVNVKTINGESILGAGDIKVQGGGIGGDVEDVTEIQGNEFVLLMDGDKVLRVPMSVLKAWLGVPSEPSEPDQPDEPTTPDVDENGYIVFADEEVKRVLMANGVSSDGVGITKADAEKVTSIGTWFKGNTAITSFDEFEKFTGVKVVTGGWAASAFYDCTNLTHMKLPLSVMQLGIDAFMNTPNLAMNVVLPNLTSVNFGAFETSGIVKVLDLGKITTIPKRGASSRNHRFIGNCQNLTVAIMPSTLQSMNDSSVENCRNLQAFICRAATPPAITSESIYGNGENMYIYVPDASVEAYKTATNWSTYASRIKGISELPIDNPTLYDEIKDYLG